MVKVEKLKEEIIRILSDKKANDIIEIDLKGKSIIADYFIICSGNSTTQVKALINYVDEELSKKGINGEMIEPLRREGLEDGRWAVIDYGSIIVHVFLEEVRKIYALDELWAEREKI